MTKYAIYGYDADGTRVQKEENDTVKKRETGLRIKKETDYV